MLAAALALVSLTTGMALGMDALRDPRGWLPALAQVVGLPLAAYALGRALGWPEPLVAGLVLLAATPAAVPAQLLTALAGGDVTLSRAVLAAGSLAALVTLPALTAGMGPDFAGPMALLVALPLAAGMALRRLRPALVAGAEGLAATAASFATGGLMLAVFLHGGAWRGAILAAVALGLAGVALARILGRRRGDAAIALGMALPLRNVALPLALALGAGRPDWALPAACYGIVMYALALAHLGLRLRSRARR